MALLTIVFLAGRFSSGPRLPEDELSETVEEVMPIPIGSDENAQPRQALGLSKFRSKNGEEGYTVRLKEPLQAGRPVAIKLPEGGSIILGNEGGHAPKRTK